MHLQVARNHTKLRQKEDKIIHTIPSCDTTSSVESMEREWLCIKNEPGKRLGLLQENTSSIIMMSQALDILKNTRFLKNL